MLLPRTFFFLVLTATLISLIAFFFFNTSPPILKNAALTLQEDASIDIDFLKINEDLNDFKLHIVKFPQNGKIEGSPPNVTYRPNENYFGSDEIEYQAWLNRKRSNIGVISLSIKPVNDFPVAENSEHVLKEDQNIIFKLKATDVDNDDLSFKITQLPPHGETEQYSQKIIYTPNKDYFGKDELKFEVADNQGGYDTGSINLSIHPVNDIPVTQDSELKINTLDRILLKFQVKDIDNPYPKINIVGNHYLGKITHTGDRIYYQVDENSDSYDEDLHFFATDHESQSKTSRLRITYEKQYDLKSLKIKLQKKYPKAGIAVSNDKDHNLIINNRLFIPASLIKIATAAAALYYLKGDYYFKTEIFKDVENRIYIKGYGDPTLSGQDLDDIVKAINKNITPDDFYQLVLDRSVFNGDLSFLDQAKNDRYFNAPASALAINFNTAYIKIKNRHKIVSLYPSTPVTQTIFQKVKRLRGIQYFSIASDSKAADQYTGEVLEMKLVQFNLPVSKNFIFGKTPESARLIYTHYSKKNLKAVIRLMLKKSNNFIANQLLLIIAQQVNPKNVGIDTGTQIIKRFLIEQVGVKENNFVMIEGSGLSRKNKITPKAMLQLLNYAKKFIDLFPNIKDSKYPELSKLGDNKRFYAKTGTLRNVSNIAGYYWKQNKWMSLVVMSDMKRSLITADLLKN
ncbi:MAG: tandem-95 repeat protein [Deltaproteobacteria bacterium]|nr:tandem-95 repeat protein [Deltaproteobacteria bacterium]